MQETSKSNSSQTFRGVITKMALAIALAIAASGIAAAPAAQAAPNSTRNTPVNVVGHVALADGNVTRILLVNRDGKEYLVLGLDSSAHVSMVDVSDPRRPHALDSAALASGKPGAELNVVASTLSVFGKSEPGTPESADPKELRNFSGVTAFVVDAAHGLIYATNNDGLWIVKTKRQASEDAGSDYYGG